ncbi:MAG: hypothetical protein IPI48_08850 [bacterium]|nr:hypothetical protein [bacterium]
MNRPRERKNTVRNILVVAGLLAALGAAGCGKAPAAAPREVARNVRVLELSATSLAEYHEISGPVAPVRGADLAAEESGPITAIRAAKGARVSAGQVLVEQERTILKAEMDAAASQLKTQDFNLDRVRQLHEAGKVSEFDLLNAESAQAQVASLADISRRRWERAAIKAPFAGIVAERFVEPGRHGHGRAAGRAGHRSLPPEALGLRYGHRHRVGARGMPPKCRSGKRASGVWAK